jgi:hypothetical protein
MLKKLFHTIVASSIAVTPLSASAADQYFFRYKNPFTVQIPPVTDEEYGVGNDSSSVRLVLIRAIFLSTSRSDTRSPPPLTVAGISSSLHRTPARFRISQSNPVAT